MREAFNMCQVWLWMFHVYELISFSEWCHEESISVSLLYRWRSWGINSVQSLSCVWCFVIPWTAAHQAFLSISNSWSLLKLMSIESMMTSNHLILCCPLLILPSIFPSIKVFSNESVLCTRWPSIGVSALTAVFPMKIQDWSPLEWTGWISLLSKGLSRVVSNTTIQKHQFFGAQLSL